MKRLIYIGILLMALGCSSKSQPSSQSTSREAQVRDSISMLSVKVQVLHDSISVLLARPVMTSDQFIKIYKYERLEKYYKLCVKKPSQWIYYKGWSIRVFTQ